MSTSPPGAAYTVDGQRVARERFYALACDPARSVVVEACAGAGKTWMLVSRILRALLEGARPQDIVAITFTRKAAGEMRERLGEWLDEFAHADAAQRVAALQQRGCTPAQAQDLAPRLATLQQSLLRQARGVEIRTFHAWFSQLLRAAPLELLQAQGLSPELQLLEDESDLLQELWPRFHAAVLADAALLQDYRELSQEQGRNKLQSWLQSAFAKRVEIRLAQRSGVLDASMPGAEAVAPVFAESAPLEVFACLRGELQALALSLGVHKNKTPKEAAVAIEQALALPDEAAMAGVCKALFTAQGSLRKALGDAPELLAIADALTQIRQAQEQQRARQAHRQMSRLADALLTQFEALKRERGLVDMNDLERGALALLGDPELSGWVQQRLDRQVRHLLIDEFQDTSPLQWHALHAWLSGYAGAGGGQHRPSVFIVGDPKQSIYRFRRAEPRVFAAARDFVREALDGVLLACDHTRRNSPPVLDAVNAVFDVAQRAGQYEGFRDHTTETSGDAADPLSGVFVIDDAEPVPGDAAAPDAAPLRDAMTWRPSLTEPRREAELHRREAEARRVAACIAQLLRGAQVQPGDIFVLARKREGLRVLAQVLKAQGIAHAAPEDLALLDAPDVRDLLALLDVLASPGHNLSLAHALRSPLFAVDEAELLWLAERAGSAAWLDAAQRASAGPRSWWDALMGGADGAGEGGDADAGGGAATATLPQDLTPALARARELLGRWAPLAAQRSPHDLLDTVICEGELMARLAQRVPPSELRARQHAVQALLALALELDGGRYASLYGFVRALKRRALKLGAPVEPDAVQLLTVHGAKGLEARVVVLLDCEAGPARAETMGLALGWPVQQPTPQTVAFLASESRPPPSLQALLDDEREQRQREELNALYVAMTRARSRLVISRTPARRQAASATWWERLAPLGQPLSVPADLAPQDARTEPALLRVLPSLPPSEPRPVPIAAVEAAPDGADPLGQGPAPVDESAALGEALHRVLEWFSGPRGRSQPLARLLGAAAQMYGLDGRRSERLQRAVEAILGSAACAPLLDPAQLLWSGNEVPVSWREQDLRLDRLVCRAEPDGPCWWVLDYKLNPRPEANPEYLQQLWRYREAVRQLQPGERVRCAFISGQGRLIVCSDAQLDAAAEAVEDAAAR
ncbi:UvrD-helicase domain-containing protein [Pelomonas sp. CA6]|uniref:UvrD-helicase domain-containing protein n=1 Tax=Pelomonas sp. CA6 TaxID=2907999 RepID=UPI001F4C3054|nr:UvrD-helicase domain-containing protein [Pelomonas sp. CA6]MCH7344123.1 UvrD-helicase domain-containing protein [Pelomonas sp. CA6]